MRSFIVRSRSFSGQWDSPLSRSLTEKGKEYYKRKIKNKAVDTVLNIIFPD
jgi:hypothetical protein